IHRDELPLTYSRNSTRCCFAGPCPSARGGASVRISLKSLSVVTFGDPIVLRRPPVWTPTVERLRPPRDRLGPSGRPAPGSSAHGAAGRHAACSRQACRRSQQLE